MALHKVTKGLNLPISGAPLQVVEAGLHPTKVAVLAADYVDMRPKFKVQVDDPVRRGQVLFEDKRTPGVVHTSPGAGKVVGIHRGERRALQAVVIELSESEKAGEPREEDFQALEAFEGKDPAALSAEEIEALLLESGLWTALRTRPFSKVPAPGSRPRSIFVNAMDTNPLGVNVDVVLTGREGDFATGLACIAKLSEGKTFLCQKPGGKAATCSPAGIQVEEFTGPHPAGTVGVHIHTLDPVNREKTVWHVGYQDVIAMGKLLRSGRLDTTRVISLAGPGVRSPRLLETRLGACLDEILEGNLAVNPGEGDLRVVSGSVLHGRQAMGEVHGYLGRYHHQVSVLSEDRSRDLLGWISPGINKYSVIPVCLSSLSGKSRFDFTTTLNGAPRAIVPIGLYEKVFPFDMVTTYLLRAIAVRGFEEAEKLGCLELDEEDLALCTFVCPGKTDFGPLLRENLTRILEEG